jgi:molecular chaperone HtpG
MSAKPKETLSESIPFAAETSKVLKLMIHSLYTNKDIFLRELISNASDACDKLRYEAQSDDALLGEDAELKITLSFNEDQRTVTISDNGIGMNRDDLIAHLGTIAKSGTEEFMANLSGDSGQDMALIGQFGVGFYSAYMVADRVEVTSCKAGDAKAWHWESDGEGAFTITPADDRPRGTSITLNLNAESKEYADKFRLQHIAQTYSDHIAVPIELVGEEGAPERINEASAIWTRAKSDISEAQYKEFYHHVAHSPDEPFLTLHNKAEGVVEYTNLLFVPSMKPFDLFHPERRRRVKLYVKRVFITDENVEIVPAWLRFLRGIVDSEDLPLNISRETLQDNPLLGKIRDAITKKVLGELKKKADKAPEEYAEFWENFGPVIKEGLCEATAPKDKILPICRFDSTHAEGAKTSLADYVSRMKDGQEAIYVIMGDDADVLRRSAQLEGFKKHGLEVLLLTDPVDDFWLNVQPQFEGKSFKSVTKAGADLEAFSGEKDDAKSDEDKAESAKSKADMDALIERMKSVLEGHVREVRVTQKLAESPVCLAVGEGDMDLRMERFMLENKQLAMSMPKILEINPDHAIIKGMAAKLSDASASESIRETALLLLDQAKIQEGEPPADAAAFAARLSALMAKGF